MSNTTLKKINVSIVTLLLSVISFSLSSAQVNVSISKERVRVNGKLMYAHQVLKGQTIYSICKAYNVTSEQLQQANPTLSSGLKEGMLLVIPMEGDSTKDKEETKKGKEKKKKESAAEILAQRAQEGADEIFKEGEKDVEKNAKEISLSGIFGKSNDKEKVDKKAERERIKEERKVEKEKEREKASAKESVSENVREEINIEIQQKEKEVENKTDDTYITHKVKWYEDIDEIATEYKINKEVIKFYNGLKSNSLDQVSELKIPTDKTLERAKSEYVKSIYSDNKAEEDKTSKTQNSEGDDIREGIKKYMENDKKDNSTSDNKSKNKKNVIEDDSEKRISIILPLKSPNGKLNSTYMDFYSGALLAAKDLKEESVDLQIDIIDQNMFATTQELIDKNNLENSDLIIGPIKSSVADQYIDFINTHQIPMISPLDPSSDSLVNKSNFFIQTALSTKEQDRLLVKWIEKSIEEKVSPKVIVVVQDGGKDLEYANTIMNNLDKQSIKYEKINFAITQATAITSTFRNKISPDQDNIVIVASTNEGFVAEVLRNLSLTQASEDNITIFGTSKWRNFETLDLNLLYRYNLHILMPYCLDLSKEDVQKFVLEYRAMFNSEPNGNSLSGYDITKFFAVNVRKNLKYLLQNIDNQEETIEDILQGSALQQSYKFLRANQEEVCGFKNSSSMGLIYHPNFTSSSTIIE